MHRAQATWRYIAFGGGPLAIFAAWRSYVITHSPEAERQFQVVSTVSAFAVVVGLGLYRYFHPEQRPSRLALVTIALVLIVIAVLFRHHSSP